MMRFLVVFEKTRTGYSAYFPDVDGCVAAGRTTEETRRLAEEALQVHFEGLVEESPALPEPSATDAEYVTIESP